MPRAHDRTGAREAPAVDDRRREAARRARERREGFPPGVTVFVDEDGAEVWEFDPDGQAAPDNLTD